MTRFGKGEIISSVRWISASVFITLLIFLAVSFILWKTGVTDRYLEYYAFVCCILGSCIAGFGGGRIFLRRGFLCGIGYGIVYLFLLIMICYFALGVVTFSAIIHPKWVICIVLSGLSGTFSVNLRKE